MSNLTIGTKIRFSGTQPWRTKPLDDVTLGKVYTIEGIDEDDEEYFLDDIGEPNFAASCLDGDGVFEIVENK